MVREHIHRYMTSGGVRDVFKLNVIKHCPITMVTAL